jgi:glycine dehydrogenase subunit 2
MKLIFEKGKPGRTGCTLPLADVPAATGITPEMVRPDKLPLPEVSEIEVVRHYTELSRRNFGVDNNFYPLGSCTMKYNPKLNEELVRLPGLTQAHPLADESLAQGTLEILFTMQQWLATITGMAQFTLQPAAGAHGELTGIMLIKAFHAARQEQRTKILVPDSSHGTNPASAALCGYEVETIPSDAQGEVDMEKFAAAMSNNVAAIMLTNPNTLGLFERRILDIAALAHKHGCLLYYDGANVNAILGKCRPGDMGFDVVHLNLHKSFATPHGGGGPGSGPVGVSERLVPFLPTPVVARGDQGYFLDHDRKQSIGRVIGFYGNVGVIVRAYAYLLTLGRDGVRAVGEQAVLNANYLRQALQPYYTLPYARTCMHEFVLSGEKQTAKGVHTINIAKRIIDLGMHPPTIYFPLIVKEAIMIEPTETETRETMDEFIAIMRQIAREAEQDPDIVTTAPHDTPVGKLDEVMAAKKPNFKFEG